MAVKFPNQPLSREDPLEEELATHSHIPVWRIPRTKEPGGLQSVGSQRVRHNQATEHARAYSHMTLDDQDGFSPLGNTVSLGRHVQVRTWVSLESAVPLSWGRRGAVPADRNWVQGA